MVAVRAGDEAQSLLLGRLMSVTMLRMCATASKHPPSPWSELQRHPGGQRRIPLANCLLDVAAFAGWSPALSHLTFANIYGTDFIVAVGST